MDTYKQRSKGKEMKNLYAIKNAKGAVICHQLANSGREAVESAKNFYGFNSGLKKAVSAEFVRKN